MIERAVVLADGPALTRDDLPDEIRRPNVSRRSRSTAAVERASKRAAAGTRARVRAEVGPSWNGSDDGDEPDDAEFEQYERQRLQDALGEADGNKSEAARLLGMPRSTFFSKLKKHGLAG